MEETSVVFDYILKIAEKENVSRINELDGLWEYKVDDLWEFKVNGHNKELEGVPPFHALVMFNGWVAGLVNPYGGIIAAGDAANEETFIEALKNHLNESAA